MAANEAAGLACLAHGRHVQAIAQLQAADSLAAALAPHQDVVVQRVRWRRLCAQAHVQMGSDEAAVLAARSGLLLALAHMAQMCAPRSLAQALQSPTSLAQALRTLRRAMPPAHLRPSLDVCMQEARQLLDVMVQAGDRRAQQTARRVGRALQRIVS